MQPPVVEDAARKRLPGFLEFVALVALMMGFTAFAVDNLLPAFPRIAGRFAITDPNELQLVVYVYMFGFGVAQLAYGPASDVVGRRPAFLTGVAVFLVGCVLAIVATSFEGLLFARFIQGIGGATGRVLAVAIVRDRFSGREMARVMSLTIMVFITVPMLAPAIGGLILALGDWHWIFGAMFAVTLVTGAWFAWRMPETLHPEFRLPFSASSLIGGLRETVTCRVTIGYSTAFGCMFGCIMGYVGSSQQIFAESVYGLGALFPVVFGSVAATMGLASLVNATLVRRFGMRRISHLSLSAFMALSALQFGCALLFGGRPPLFVFVGILGLSQFFSSLTMPNFNALAMEPLGRIAGTASSFIGSYTTIVGAGLGILVGQAFDGTVLPLASGYLALSVAAFLIVMLTEKGRMFRSGAVAPAKPT